MYTSADVTILITFKYLYEWPGSYQILVNSNLTAIKPSSSPSPFGWEREWMAELRINKDDALPRV